MSSNTCEGVAILRQPAYRERFLDFLFKALRENCDIVQYWDGGIVSVGSKVVMHSYGWDEKRREFDRAKLVKRANSGDSDFDCDPNCSGSSVGKYNVKEKQEGELVG